MKMQPGAHLVRWRAVLPVLVMLVCAVRGLGAVAWGSLAPMPAGRWDPRIRVVSYSADFIYRVRGYAGFETDVQFARGERITGVAVGDTKGISVATMGNQLFLKPRSVPVVTNLTVLTDRRTYLFEYSAAAGPPPFDGASTYVLRFEYPSVPARTASTSRSERVTKDMATVERTARRNYDYWYCGSPSLKPIEAWDDGIETHLVFGARAQLPAVFALNDDGTESLVNFHMRGDEMIVERIARRFIVRRGKLAGCIVDRAYSGAGRQLTSGTIAPDVLRVTRAPTRVAQGEPGVGVRP